MTLSNIENILKKLSPLEVIEMCGIDDDSEGLVYALSDHIEEFQDDIKDRLEENGLIDEEDY